MQERASIHADRPILMIGAILRATTWTPTSHLAASAREVAEGAEVTPDAARRILRQIELHGWVASRVTAGGAEQWRTTAALPALCLGWLARQRGRPGAPPLAPVVGEREHHEAAYAVACVVDALLRSDAPLTETLIERRYQWTAGRSRCALSALQARRWASRSAAGAWRPDSGLITDAATWRTRVALERRALDELLVAIPEL